MGTKDEAKEGTWQRGTTEEAREEVSAVLAEHSTDEGGEPRSEGPTVGKAKPGHNEQL